MGLDVCDQVMISREQLDCIRRADTPVTRLLSSADVTNLPARVTFLNLGRTETRKVRGRLFFKRLLWQNGRLCWRNGPKRRPYSVDYRLLWSFRPAAHSS